MRVEEIIELSACNIYPDFYLYFAFTYTNSES